MYEVTALRYGTRTTRKSECYDRWSSYGEPDAELGMDYFFWVVRNGDSTIVVDTGFHPESGARRGRTCLCPPVEALARIGVDPGSVATVVLTHLHYDHTGNVGAFPQAELVVQRSRARILDERGGEAAPVCRRDRGGGGRTGCRPAPSFARRRRGDCARHRGGLDRRPLAGPDGAGRRGDRGPSFSPPTRSTTTRSSSWSGRSRSTTTSTR